MKASSRARWFLPALLIGVVISSQPGRADTTWNVWVGAQSKDLGRQALAFLPNEIWINQNDSIAWHFAVDEIHTVTFLKDQQVRPPFPVGCPGFAGPSATFDGTQCLSTPPLVKPQTFTVQFTAVGNYKVVCLVHPDMTGTVHVLKPGDALPHEQQYTTRGQTIKGISCSKKRITTDIMATADGCMRRPTSSPPETARSPPLPAARVRPH